LQRKVRHPSNSPTNPKSAQKLIGVFQLLGKFETPVVVSFHPCLARCLPARRKETRSENPKPVNDRATQKPVGSQGNFERQELSENYAIEIDDIDQGHRPDFQH
jgi:hypothetical protein